MLPMLRPIHHSPTTTAMIMVLVTVVTMGHAAPLVAGAQFDFEPLAFLPGDHYVKDHTLIRQGDRIHLFYTTGTDTLGRWERPGNEIHFGHATSTDLRHWQVHEPIITWPAADWEQHRRWAPHVVRSGDGYRLYYTGVNRRIAQTIGIAASTDLWNWELERGDAFRPDTSWATWQPGRWSDCRDPFVFRHAGSWWMIVTAATRARHGALGLARSTDGLAWVDAGPLLIGHRGEPLESAQLLERNGRWFLLFTSGRSGGTWVIESNEFDGPWEFADRRRWIEGIAPEFTLIDDCEWVSRHASYTRPDRRAFVLLFDPVEWGPDGITLATDPAPGPDWLIIEGDAFHGQPTLDDNPLLRGAPAVGPIGNGWIGTAEAFARPPDEPGAVRGDGATGRLRSIPFTLHGRSLSLRIGGTSNPGQVYVALYRAADGEILFRDTGTGAEPLAERIWWTQHLAGTEVFLELVDLDPTGHLNIDQIVEGDAAAPIARSAEITPNPFADSTTITIAVGAPATATPPPAEIRIYDIMGRRQRTLIPRAAGNGQLEAHWDGRNQTGQALAAGVYFARIGGGSAELVLRLVRIN